MSSGELTFFEADWCEPGRIRRTDNAVSFRQVVPDVTVTGADILEVTTSFVHAIQQGSLGIRCYDLIPKRRAPNRERLYHNFPALSIGPPLIALSTRLRITQDVHQVFPTYHSFDKAYLVNAKLTIMSLMAFGGPRIVRLSQSQIGWL
jgi:hypothetical protein